MQVLSLQILKYELSSWSDREEMRDVFASPPAQKAFATIVILKEAEIYSM